MPNHSSLARLRVVNFGCIGPDGVTVDMADIVCLVGANNCGKSTMLRAYEAAVTSSALKAEEKYSPPGAGGTFASVEIWVRVPHRNLQILMPSGLMPKASVRSQWTWPLAGVAPVRKTWDPATQVYAEDGKAAGLDNVFNSRMPQPFRVKALEGPQQEHDLLMKLLLGPIIEELKELAIQEGSPLRKAISDVKTAASVPVEKFKAKLDKVKEKVNATYRKVFAGSEIAVNVELQELKFDPMDALNKGSMVQIIEPTGRTILEAQQGHRFAESSFLVHAPSAK